MQGGVLALDRMQQLLISVLAGIMYFWIVVRTSPTTAEFPAIPDSLLGLMGASSAAYVLGKGARKAGPNVRKAGINTNGEIVIQGLCLSPQAKVTINNDAATPIHAEEKDDGVVILKMGNPKKLKEHDHVSVTVTNVDEQSATWEGSLVTIQ
jgi:hypothetical protein